MQTPAPAAKADLGRVGVWSVGVRFQPPPIGEAAAREIEQLGFKAVWVPGGSDNRVLTDMDRLVDATSALTIASGILNIWRYEPAEIGAWWAAAAPQRRTRLMLGLGVGHAPEVGAAYRHPLAKMRGFVEGARAAGMAPERMCLAALGPKMVELAGARTAGAHPYLVPPEHTAEARRIMGPNAWLAPEQGVVFDRDPGKAREVARKTLRFYAERPNYVSSWRRLGFSEEDVTTFSDRLVDAIMVWGGMEAVEARVKAHLDAGANHVCLQVVTGEVLGDFAFERAVWREFAGLL